MSMIRCDCTRAENEGNVEMFDLLFRLKTNFFDRTSNCEITSGASFDELK